MKAYEKLIGKKAKLKSSYSNEELYEKYKDIIFTIEGSFTYSNKDLSGNPKFITLKNEIELCDVKMDDIELIEDNDQ